MTEIRRWLQKHDPVQSEPGLSAEEARALRGSILRKLDGEPPRAPFLTRSLLPAVAILTITLAGLVAVARWKLPESQPSPAHVSEVATPISQVQFSTPGGTRIVWVFNPDLDF